MNVFDLRGPDFLSFFLVLLGLMFVAALLLRWGLRGPGGDMSHLVPSLDATEAAYLAGGPKMVVDTALAGLVHGGAIKLQRSSGTFSVNGPLIGNPNPVERAVYGLIERGTDKLSSLRACARSLTKNTAERL